VITGSHYNPQHNEHIG